MTTRPRHKCPNGRCALSLGLVRPVVLAVGLVAYSAVAWGGVRVDGTDLQSGSARVSFATFQKGLSVRRPSVLVFTLGQALMAQGSVPGGAAPVQFGIGYGYNHLYTSFCRCACHADPKCDGITDILDVVQTIGVAFRGVLAVHDTDCADRVRTDVDCSGATDVIDVVKIINVAFRGASKATQFCKPCP